MIVVILLDRQVFAQSPKEIINSIEIKLVLIPNGTFMMGSPIEEEGRYDNEVQHKVTISRDYYLGVTEVTQGQYEKVMGTNPSKFQKQVILNKDSSMYPVEKVSWEDAVSFCKRLSELPDEKTAGRVYRLPTEAEWEYACRAESETAFHFGGSSKLSDDFAWFGNSNKQTHPVGQKKPNAWGLYDMHGNAAEWVIDGYANYMPQEAVVNAAKDWARTDKPDPRAVRGGSWEFPAAECRSSARLPSDDEAWKYQDPNLPLSPWWYTDDPARGVGFRLLRPLQTLPRMEIEDFWKIDSEDIQYDVDDRLNEGRGVLGLVDKDLPKAILDLQKK
jgi:formylglycine-generating enzyme required for sulfatase activity